MRLTNETTLNNPTTSAQPQVTTTPYQNEPFSPRGQAAQGDSDTHARGGHGIFGDPLVSDKLKNAFICFK